MIRIEWCIETLKSLGNFRKINFRVNSAFNLFIFLIANIFLKEKSKVHAMQNYVDNHQIDFHGYHSIENNRFSGKNVDLSF